MTSYNGTIILGCSSCKGHITHMPLASGNTFGARYWTDGWRDAPMLPAEPWLVECPHCKACVWLGELHKLGECEPYGEPGPEFTEARGYITLSEGDYLSFLDASEGLPAKKERYLRMESWWRGNDLHRNNAGGEPISASSRENLRALLGFMSPQAENDRVMTAEIYRQLGNFEAATKTLEGSFSEGMKIAVDQILDLTNKQDCIVAELKF
jgi:hypothetical protein